MDGHKGQIVGYVRVSAADQNDARQLAALGEVDELFSEKASVKDIGGRPQLQDLIKYVRKGDVVRVKSPERLARSTRDLLDIVERLQEKGVSLQFVDSPALNTDTPQGAFMLTILAAVAQVERQTIRERQAEGIAIAKQKGVYGRGTKIDVEQIAEAREQIDAGVPKPEVARRLGVSRQTLYTAFAGQGRYVEDAIRG